MKQEDLTRPEAHFAFGGNTTSYAEMVTDVEIVGAKKALSLLLGGTRLHGQRLLDIGCGSGLHCLAALRFGAKEQRAVAYVPDRAATTQALLERYAPAGTVFRVPQVSVFSLDPSKLANFDTVHPWGVFDHTGDMGRAICCAESMCAPERRFAFAIYRCIWMDWFWRIENRWYAKVTSLAQARAQGIHVGPFRLGLLVTGRSFRMYLANCHSNRGMYFQHDLHDWMGGWPYESVQPSEVDSLMGSLGFVAERAVTRKGKLLGRYPGLFGSGCDEYVYMRAA